MARIAAVANGLTRFPGGAFSCPAESGGQLRLTFFTRPGGPVVARLTAQSGPPLQQQVLANAGASWPVEPGSAS